MLGFRPAQGSQPISEREQRWRGYLSAIERGDSQALAQLYDESAATFLGLALRIMKNDADAEEIVLDVFEQVWRTAPSFDPTRGSVARWLTLLVRSRAVDRLRTAASKHDREHLPIAGGWDLVSHEPLPDRITLFNEERGLIRTALQNLPGEQRQAIELAYFSGLTQAEIAAALSLPLGTVKTRTRAAIDKLRLFLMESGAATAESS